VERANVAARLFFLALAAQPEVRMSTRSLVFRLVTSLALCAAPVAEAQQVAQRPMNFLDVQLMRSAGSLAVSPDGRWVLYTLSVPDWKEARSTTDIWLVSAERGVSSARQLTFTKDKSEGNPAWSTDGSFIVFSSNRDAPASAASQNQLYMMRPDGGSLARSPTRRMASRSSRSPGMASRWSLPRAAPRTGSSGSCPWPESIPFPRHSSRNMQRRSATGSSRTMARGIFHCP
jgi:hypothetical protein